MSLMKYKVLTVQSKLVNMVELELVFLGRKFTGQFLLIDQPMGVLGRNILNVVSITFDGPREKWDEHKRLSLIHI